MYNCRFLFKTGVMEIFLTVHQSHIWSYPPEISKCETLVIVYKVIPEGTEIIQKYNDFLIIHNFYTVNAL